MKIRELSIAGAWEFTPAQHGDDRGVFLEWFRGADFRETTGHDLNLAQANCSVSAAGTVRGIHFADVPPGQAKYVACMSGAIFDVVVDIRVGSPTYGQWEGVVLDDVSRSTVYVSEGLGHAFMALEDRTVVNYLCSAPYAPEREHGIHPLDARVGIAWPRVGRDGTPLDPLLSPKDEASASLEEAAAAGLLPSYEAAAQFVSELGSS